MVYDVKAETHAKISSGDLPIVAPRPCWKPAPRPLADGP